VSCDEDEGECFPGKNKGCTPKKDLRIIRTEYDSLTTQTDQYACMDHCKLLHANPPKQCFAWTFNATATTQNCFTYNKFPACYTTLEIPGWYSGQASCDGEIQTPISPTEIWNINQTNFSPNTIAETGVWGEDEMCPEGGYAIAYQLYVAPLCQRRCETDDDVALMGVKLYCADYHDPVTIIQEITSSVMSPCERKRGETCKWMTIFRCPDGHYTRKSRYLSEFFHKYSNEEGNSTMIASDPMGGMNLDMGCTDGTEIYGDGIKSEEVPPVDGVDTTEWSAWKGCPTNYAICGIRSKVHQGQTDRTSNMGQTEVMFHCCQLPPGVTG